MAQREQRTQAGQVSVLSVRGSVVDCVFAGRVPEIHSKLVTGEEGGIVIEVLSHLDERTVRGIALTTTQGLARGAAVTAGSSAGAARCGFCPPWRAPP